MRKKEKMIAARVSDKLLKEIDLEVDQADYLNVSRSEMIEIMLEVLFMQVKDKDKFSEYLRGQIVEKRKSERKKGEKGK